MQKGLYCLRFSDVAVDDDLGWYPADNYNIATTQFWLSCFAHRLLASLVGCVYRTANYQFPVAWEYAKER